MYDIDIAHKSVIRELARRSAGQQSFTVRLLRYNSNICYVSNINAFFRTYRCPLCDQFIGGAPNLERHLTTCKERLKHVLPVNVYQMLERLFDKLDSFRIPYSDDQKLSENMAIFDFESNCVQEDKFRDTNFPTWISEHNPLSVSISSNLIKAPVFLCNSNTGALVESSVDAIEGLVS